LWALSLLVPVPLLNTLVLIPTMLPLWLLHDSGISGLGEPSNGFFVPSVLGYAIAALSIWFVCFLLFLLSQSGPKKRANAALDG
jgi:hypothetical protein